MTSFSAKFDPINKGKPVYHFSMRDEQNPEIKLGDKTHTILYNMCDFSKLKESERKNFFSYLMGGMPCSSFTKKTEERLQVVKNNEDWRIDYMTLEMKFKERERKAVATATLAAREEGISLGREEGIQQGMQQGTHARNVEIARNLRNMNMQASDIAKATGLTLEEIEAL